MEGDGGEYVGQSCIPVKKNLMTGLMNRWWHEADGENVIWNELRR